MAPFDDITEPAIAALVERFYSKARRDPMIGPVFSAAVEDWDTHLRKLCDFWSSVMLTTGRYKGRPIPAHVRINQRQEGTIEPKHFTEWLTLFEATAKDLFSPDLAASFVEKARRIAESLKLGFAFHSPTPEIWANLPPRAIRQTTVKAG